MSDVRIAPGHIVSGLGGLERSELAQLLALLEDTTLRTILADRGSDLYQSLQRITGNDDEPSSKVRRHQIAGLSWSSANLSDAALRLRLWTALRESLELAPEVPFSSHAAGQAAVDMAHASADTLARSLSDLDRGSDHGRLSRTARKTRERIHSLISGEAEGSADFTRIAQAQAAHLATEAARQGRLREDDQAELARRIREQLAELPVEERDESIERALRGGDRAALSFVASGTSLISLGIAVDLAGFSAYILAAQVAGVVPLLGGKFAVSTLAVFANPVVAAGALLGGGYLTNRHIRSNLRRQLAAGITILLALNGLSTGRDGQRACVESLRDPDAAYGVDSDGEICDRLDRKRRRVRDILGENLPPAPGAPPAKAAPTPKGRTAKAVESTLFQGETKIAHEALLVGGLTVGDIVADAAAIDPLVVNAADFSRAADLDGLFAFGAFAEDASELTGEAATGFYANLQGYVAEQLVATRLVEQGHQVELPDSSAQPGHDILVDGEPFQIKCSDDPHILEEHFSAYPDIPVIANSELVEQVTASSAAWTDKVFPVEGFDQTLTTSLMASSLEAGAELNDLPIPVFALGVSAARHMHAWWRGTVPLSDLPFEVALDGALKGNLALAGMKAGEATGLVLLGPAGGLVLGSAGSVSALFANPSLRRTIDRQIWSDWYADIEQATVDFEAALRDALHRKLAILREKAEAIEVGSSSEKAWIKQRLYDQALALAEGLFELEDLSAASSSTERARAALKLMTRTGTHPWTVQTPLTRLWDTLSAKPSLSRRTRDTASKKFSDLAAAWHHTRRS